MSRDSNCCVSGWPFRSQVYPEGTQVPSAASSSARWSSGCLIAIWAKRSTRPSPARRPAAEQPATRPLNAVPLRCRCSMASSGVTARRGDGVLGVERVHRRTVHRHVLAGQDPLHPAAHVLVRVRDVVHDDADRPRVTVQRRGPPLLRRAGGGKGDQPLPGRIDVGRVPRRAPHLIAHAPTLDPPAGPVPMADRQGSVITNRPAAGTAAAGRAAARRSPPSRRSRRSTASAAARGPCPGTRRSARRAAWCRS